MSFSHVNIVARDAERLRDYYTAVFGAEQAGPRRVLREPWLARGTGLPGASLAGYHVRFPGDGDDGPTLEIFSFDTPGEERPPVPVDATGLMHFAVTVADIDATLERILGAGGSALGEVSEATIEGVGSARFVYTRDPEGNICELQAWM